MKLAFILFFTLTISTFTQSEDNDLRLLENSVKIKHTVLDSNNDTQINSKNRLFNGIILFYQKYISPMDLTNCPYHPSCSEFCRQMITRKGVISGILYGVDRLSRCTPLGIKDIPVSKLTSSDKYLDPIEDYIGEN